MIVFAHVFLILFVPLLLHGAPTPANDDNHPSGQSNWPQSGSNLLHILNPPDPDPKLAPGHTDGGNLNPKPKTSDLGLAPAHAGTQSENLGSHSFPLSDQASISYKPPLGWKRRESMRCYLPPRSTTFDARLQLADLDTTRFLDFTRHLVGDGSGCELPFGTWYRRATKVIRLRRTHFSLGQTIVRVDVIAVTPQGLLILIPRNTEITVSNSPDQKVRVPSDLTIRVVSVPYAAQDWIWHVCLTFYYDHHAEIEVQWHYGGKFQYMNHCFLVNMWDIGRPFTGDPKDWDWYIWNTIS